MNTAFVVDKNYTHGTLSMYSCNFVRVRSLSGNSSGVERCLAKAKVAGSNPVSRSKKYSFFIFTQGYFMKSIIEQASSILKAIEKAWNQADKPKEFSIKIFEEEERNFFGMSTKPAKIGIFFGDKPAVHEKPTSKPRVEIKECRPEVRESKPSFAKASEDRPKATAHPQTSSAKATQSTATTKPNAINRTEHPARSTATQGTAAKPAQQPRTQNTPNKPQAESADNTEDIPRRTPAAWNDTMIATTHNWLKKTLSLMNMSSIEFSSEVAGKNLKLTFNTPLIADPAHEKQLFRSFAHLIMSSLRNQYKQEIKDLKVILIRPE